jgi:hypothetical protein
MITRVIDFFRKKRSIVSGNRNYIPYSFWSGDGNDSDELPKKVIEVYDGSSTLATCINTLAKFIAGRGLQSENTEQVSENNTLRNLIQQTSFQLAMWGGYAWLVTHNIEGRQIDVVPMEFFRIKDLKGKKACIVNINGEIQDGYDNIDVVSDYAQIKENAKDIGLFNYKAIYYDYISPSKTAYLYPKPLYYSVLRDAFAEKELKQAKYRDIRSGFSARIVATIYQNGGNPTEDEIQQDISDFQDFCGSEGATFMLRYAPNRESKADFDVINAPNPDKLYEYTERSVADNIMKAFQIPQVLYGVPTAGKLGTSQEMQDAIRYVQFFVVAEMQQLLLQGLNKILELQNASIDTYNLQSL